jgi:hypothetical protein
MLFSLTYFCSSAGAAESGINAGLDMVSENKNNTSEQGSNKVEVV